MVFAIAHIRGGDEMGEAWHDDGMLMKKKNTFFDFIDCAEFLITREVDAHRTACVIEGGSAGGLLMGAVVNLRPDLFKAVHAAVPFVDVINTMTGRDAAAHRRRVPRVGQSQREGRLRLHEVVQPLRQSDERRPTPRSWSPRSFNDSQVMYWEPAKYVAKLRTLKTDANPLLLKIKMEPAGHGGAPGATTRCKDQAFEYAWLLKQVGITK